MALLSELTWGTEGGILPANLLDSSFDADGIVLNNKRNQTRKQLLRNCGHLHQKKFELVLSKLDKHAHLKPRYVSTPPPSNRLNAASWKDAPPAIDPMHTRTKLSLGRAERKRQQIENFVWVLDSIVKDGDTVVDFGAGTGPLSLPLAWVFPKVNFVLVEMKPEGVRMGNKRIQESGLKNARFWLGKLEGFYEPFDIGIALHACGEATDLVQTKCVESNAAFILCPCCIGKIQHKQYLEYPRSNAFRSALSIAEYNTLVAAADYGGWDFDTPQAVRRRLCKSYVETDRCLYASENGYTVQLFTMIPREATPKNDIIVGKLSPKVA